jgi:hypothetical protein
VGAAAARVVVVSVEVVLVSEGVVLVDQEQDLAEKVSAVLVGRAGM